MKYVLWYELFPRVQPYYAFKSNNHPVLVNILATLGTGFDCASRGELEKVSNKTYYLILDAINFYL